jgi:hypothetical protein
MRSQMDVRICLRVRERRDVDLILGQGSFNTGWHAHALAQTGAFLISSPEHHIPKDTGPDDRMRHGPQLDLLPAP